MNHYQHWYIYYEIDLKNIYNIILKYPLDHPTFPQFCLFAYNHSKEKNLNNNGY